jgi:type II secretory pathway pseudopilin PulG
MKYRAGFALLDALIALAILGTAGLSLVALVRSGLDGERRAQAQELELAAASRVLMAMTLLTRSDLDQRIGRHPVGEFVVDVERPERTLYRIALGNADGAGAELLVAVVYRP